MTGNGEMVESVNVECDGEREREERGYCRD